MYQEIRIHGLGPHDDTTVKVSPAGTTTVTGRSECGKSAILRAVCFCFFGTDERGKPFPVESIRDGHKKAHVEIITAKGAVIARSMTRTRSTRRSFYDVTYTTEDAFRAELRGLGKLVVVGKGTEPAATLIMSPMSWVSLGTGDARKLRDVLDAAAPGGTLDEAIAELLPGGLQEGDARTLGAAETLRTDLRRAAASAEGGVQALKNTEPPETVLYPDDEKVGAAYMVLEAAKAWSAHDVAVQARANMVSAAEASKKRRSEWAKRQAAIGDEPDFDAAAHKAASDALTDAEVALGRAQQARVLAQSSQIAADATEPDVVVDFEVEARKAFGKAERDLVDAERAAESSVCPTCERDGWEGPAEHVIAHGKRVTDAADALGKAEKRADKERTARRKAHRAKLAAAADVVDVAAKAEEKAGAAVAKGREGIDALNQQRTARAAWAAAVGALGQRPQIAEAGDAPAPPGSSRPTPHDVEKAESVQQRAVAGKAAAEQQERQAARANAAVDAAKQKLKTARTAADRADKVVDALRRAPSERLKKNIAALGDLGPVSIVVPHEGPAVLILIDGRPWWLASTGRQVVADLWLRLALRRGFKMTWLPIFLDNAGSWTGDWPELDGPLIRMTTVPDTDLQVAADAA